MRVYLTTPELETEAGKQLLALCIRIASDGKINLPEIKELRRWLRNHRDNKYVIAIGYLKDIMDRITADGVVDRDELLELHLALERVIPASHRTCLTQARKRNEALRRERLRKRRSLEKEREKEEQKRLQQKQYALHMRLRHRFSKVAGVSFRNDDGSERQDIIYRCQIGEQLEFVHDAYNEHSVFAIKVMRQNGEQLGYVPEYLAEGICDEIADGYDVVGLIINITGGDFEKQTLGVNFAVFFVAKEVSNEELQEYVDHVLEMRQ